MSEEIYQTHGTSVATKDAAMDYSRYIVRGVISSIVGVSPNLLVIPNTGDVNVKLQDDLDHQHVELHDLMKYYLDDGREMKSFDVVTTPTKRFLIKNIKGAGEKNGQVNYYKPEDTANIQTLI